MELWDAYNSHGEKLGFELKRGEAIPEGVFHLVAEILVVHMDGTVLLMKRDPNKDVHPGIWECSAGGSVMKGETFLEGAIRELKEETGISSSALTPIYQGSNKDCLCQGYLCRVDWPKNQIVLQEGETTEYQWVDGDTFERMFFGNEFAPGRTRRMTEFVQQNTSRKKNVVSNTEV